MNGTNILQISQHLRVEGVLDKILSQNTQLVGDVSKMSKQLDRIEASFKPHSSPYAIGKVDIPFPQKLFLGRDHDVAAIIGLLSDKLTSRVCITGIGGMGKTLLALSVIHHPIIQQIFGVYRLWVPCIKATSPDLLRRTLYTQLSITAQSYDSLDVLVKELRATEDRRLILLDNLETPWYSRAEPTNQAYISDIVSRLAEIPQIALMVTVTSSFTPGSQIQWKHYPLPPLMASAARETFIEMYPDAAKSDEKTKKIDKTKISETDETEIRKVDQ